MTIAAPPICDACSRLGPKPDGPGLACEAFPAGIPDAILVEGFDHRQAFDGDNGVRFQLEPGADGRLAAYEAG